MSICPVKYPKNSAQKLHLPALGSRKVVLHVVELIRVGCGSSHVVTWSFSLGGIHCFLFSRFVLFDFTFGALLWYCSNVVKPFYPVSKGVMLAPLFLFMSQRLRFVCYYPF